MGNVSRNTGKVFNSRRRRRIWNHLKFRQLTLVYKHFRCVYIMAGRDYSFFITEYTFFFMYVFSFVLIQVSSNSMLVGWGLLFVTHFLACISVSIQAFQRMDTLVSAVLVSCFVLVLTSLFYIALSLMTLKERSVPTQGSTKMKMSGEVRDRLNQFYELVVADICLIFIVLFAFKSNLEHMFPIYVDRVNEYGKAELKMVHLNDPQNMVVFQKSYTDFYNAIFGKNATPFIQHGMVYILYGWTWVVGGAQLSALGISGFLIYLSNDLYKTVNALV